MFSKLAAKNVRRSIRDYLVYFVTLMLAVCIFYMFNSVDEQMVMLKLRAEGSTGATMVELVVQLLSVIISFVLAFLIVYANAFIMRRRKREFGIYMALGVSNRKISSMLATETLIIGVLALAAGLVCGYFASQGMSVLTASLFEVQITDYHFIFSMKALISTCIYFAIIFVLVVLLNLRTIRKFTLAQLLAAGKENQTLRSRWLKAPGVTLVFGIIVVVLSYWIVLFFGIQAFEYTLLPGIIVNFLGTLLILYGLAARILSGRHQGRKYYKGLNMFAQRQLASRVNTNAVSMAFICSMLFLTLVVVSSSSAFNTELNQNAASLPFDASFTTHSQGGEIDLPVRQAMQEVGIPEELFSESCEFPIYESTVTYGQLGNFSALGNEQAESTMNRQTASAIAVSDYNRVLLMQGQAPLNLPEGTYALNVSSDLTRQAMEAKPDKPTIELGGASLVWSNQALRQASIWTSRNHPEVMLIVPDEVAAALGPPSIDVFVGNYAVDTAIGDQLVQEKESAINDYSVEITPTNVAYPFRYALRTDISYTNGAMNASMTFVGLYMGMIFMVAGAAILALQMLSATTDDKQRYELLSNLGVTGKMMDRSILQQVATYFFLPLGLACIHSVVGIYFLVANLFSLGGPELLIRTTGMVLMICVIYGAYFAATYLGCRRIIRTKESRRTD